MFRGLFHSFSCTVLCSALLCSALGCSDLVPELRFYWTFQRMEKFPLKFQRSQFLFTTKRRKKEIKMENPSLFRPSLYATPHHTTPLPCPGRTYMLCLPDPSFIRRPIKPNKFSSATSSLRSFFLHFLFRKIVSRAFFCAMQRQARVCVSMSVSESEYVNVVWKLHKTLEQRQHQQQQQHHHRHH